MSLKIGDMVRLKSGGPLMTVTDMIEAGGGQGEGVNCKWFKGEDLQTDCFTLDSVQLSDGSSAGGIVI